MLSTVLRHSEVEQARNLPVVLILLLCQPVLLVAAAGASTQTYAAAVVAGFAADVHLHRAEPACLRLLGRLKYGLSTRTVIRHTSLLVLLPAAGAPRAAVLDLTVALVVLNMLRLGHLFLCAFVQRRRSLPARVRNLDLSALGMPAPPPALAFRRRAVKLLLHLDLLVMAGGFAALATEQWSHALLGCGAAIVLTTGALLAMLPTVVRCRRVPSHAKVFALLNAKLAAYRPQVVLYFSYAAGSRDSAYQVNMWLETLARLDQRPLILLREVTTLRFLAYTPLPVVCIPRADDLSLLDLPEARVILYPANAGKNVHMLRMAEAQHVFIGHGDSDKLASSNRVSKVYDQIWVAGQAGQDRYTRIRHAVDTAAIVQVGRPQLTSVTPASPLPTGRATTVLYAPTWEGWTEDPYHTSLVLMGPKIIRMLLNHPDPVRILYRPHPLTGKRSAAATAAHRKITALLASANHAADRHQHAHGDHTSHRVTQAEGDTQLARLEHRMDALRNWTVAGVYGLWRKDRHALAHPPRDRWADLQHEWNRIFWQSRGSRHQVLTGQLPTLHDCFNEADLLISDVSSVVSDFLASVKPYAVTNPQGMDDELFRTHNPAASAAYLLGPSCETLQDCLAAARSAADDPRAPRRQTLKHYLLGAADPMARFNDAVNTLARQATEAYPPGAVAEPVTANPFTQPPARPAPPPSPQPAPAPAPAPAVPCNTPAPQPT
ncbi:hypothetical protein ACFY2W_15020 [Streptomyces sp. NPDC001262]|uniref:hypothetical protein n=1 Tax=Streptomyces sp. NPDC001262 TaxID=3364552 RepID=UPI0036835EC0